MSSLVIKITSPGHKERYFWGFDEEDNTLSTVTSRDGALVFATERDAVVVKDKIRDTFLRQIGEGGELPGIEIVKAVDEATKRQEEEPVGIPDALTVAEEFEKLLEPGALKKITDGEITSCIDECRKMMDDIDRLRSVLTQLNNALVTEKGKRERKLKVRR